MLIEVGIPRELPKTEFLRIMADFSELHGSILQEMRPDDVSSSLNVTVDACRKTAADLTGASGNA